MSEVKLARKRVVPGKADRLREWYAELQDREDEILETLRHDGVYTETAFLPSSGGETHLYVYMEAPDLEAALASGDEESFEVHEQHHAVLAETLTGEWEDLAPIAHFRNPDRE
jgi:uncharacterized protein YdaT